MKIKIYREKTGLTRVKWFFMPKKAFTIIELMITIMVLFFVVAIPTAIICGLIYHFTK